MTKAEEMLDRMTQGNRRYVSQGGQPALNSLERSSAERGQPQATILTCSDLRAFPEQVFGLKPGNLNILQTAACICSDPIVSFSGASTTSGLILVLGHNPCPVIDFSLNNPGAANDNAISAAVGETLSGLVAASTLPMQLLVYRTHTMRVAIRIQECLQLPNIRIEAAVLDESDGSVTLL
jgi:carbonic anhydrase